MPPLTATRPRNRATQTHAYLSQKDQPEVRLIITPKQLRIQGT